MFQFSSCVLFTDPNAFTYNELDVLVFWSCQIQHSDWLYALLIEITQFP
jgi:hypothetical protein